MRSHTESRAVSVSFAVHPFSASMECQRQDPSVGEVALLFVQSLLSYSLDQMLHCLPTAALVGVYFAPAFAAKVHLVRPCLSYSEEDWQKHL